ncbi:MAG: hypothetical protein EXX96DRAFT_543897 [Benjaminiella poitrasii]|nr:MAG: hypothetical protein EXX96DRAFT_543897 [Benjaminiella poitrasii]
MSLNTVIAFALLLKKITQKGSMKRKNLQQRLRRTTSNRRENSSVNSSNSEEIYNSSNGKRNSVVVSTSAMKNAFLRASVLVDDESIVIVKKEEENDFIDDLQFEQMAIKAKDSVQNNNIIIRDFAYPVDSPLHFGLNKKITALEDSQSTISLSSPDFTGRDARALFDFKPETEYEVGLKAGQSIWVQYRQCPGWLIADVQDETGLIPETYMHYVLVTHENQIHNTGQFKTVLSI